MAQKFSVFDCGLVYLPGSKSPAGTLTPVASEQEIPFEIKRAYYLYDIPGGAIRGGHAHRQLQQCIVALSGSFDMLLDDGTNKKTVHLNRSNMGLMLRPGIWREITNFSSGAICLALASRKFDEGDYIRKYDDFIRTYGTN